MGWGGIIGGGWGITPWGSGAEGLRLVFADAYRENMVRFTFNQSVYVDRLGGPRDGSVPSRYVIVPDEESRDPYGALPRPVLAARVDTNGTVDVDVWLDRPMSAYPARYTALVTQLQSASGTSLLPNANRFLFFGGRSYVPPPSPELAVSRKDFANPQNLAAVLDPLPTSTDPLVLGTFPTDALGDYATDEGVVSYVKRVLRRLVTRKGAFIHLPTYGVGITAHVKRLGLPAMQQALVGDIEDQIRQEPETESVSVQLNVRDGGVWVFDIKARMRTGEDVPVPPVAFDPTRL